MAITLYKQKLSIKVKNLKKNSKKKSEKNIFFGIFSFKIMKWRGIHELRPETGSRNSGDHEL